VLGEKTRRGLTYSGRRPCYNDNFSI